MDPRPGGGLRLRWTAPVNEPHALQSSPDLRAWTTVLTTNAASPYFQLDLPPAGDALATFYRLAPAPP